MKLIILIISLIPYASLYGMDEKPFFHAQAAWQCNNAHFKSICTKGAQDLNNSSLQFIMRGVESIFAKLDSIQVASSSHRQAYLLKKTKKLLNHKKLSLSPESKTLLLHPLENNNLIQITAQACRVGIEPAKIAVLQRSLIKIFGSEHLLASVGSLTSSLMEHQRNTIDKYLQEGTPINLIVSPYGGTPLMASICDGWEDLVEFLLSIPGIDVNAQIYQKDYMGYTALHQAILHGEISMAVMLLSHQDLDINIQTALGESAVMLAILHGHLDIVKIILEKFPQANLLLTNTDGLNALDLATTSEIRSLLKQHISFS